MTQAREDDSGEDFLLRASRVFFYVGIFFSSLLSIRVGGGLTVGDILLLIGIAFAGAGTLMTRMRSIQVTRTRISPPVWLALTMLVVGAVLSAGRAVDPQSTVEIAVRLVLVMFLLPVSMRAVFKEKEQFKRALVAFALGAAVCGSGTVLQYLAGASIIPGADVTNVGRFSGFAQSVSDTGAITSLGVVSAVGLFAGTAGRQRFGALILLSFSAIGLFLSGSVSGLLAVLVGCLVLAARRVIKVRHIVLIAGVGSVILGFVISIQVKSNALDPLTRILQTLGLGGNVEYNTSGSRLSTYQAAVDGFIRNPIVGAGLDYSSTIADGRFPAHNLFIAAAYCGGTFVLLAVILAIVRPFRGQWIHADRSLDTSIALALAVSAIAFAMTAPSLFNRYLWIPISFVLVAKSLAMFGEQSDIARTNRLQQPSRSSR
ncbi:O-antigen ligase family protein [Compostimonas suwonensis]|nr:O-antigen ligase family protein [Compostimonas suwonensis]